MNILKKIIFPLFSLFLAYRSVELMNTLVHTSPDNYALLDKFIIAFLLSIFITGVFAFPGFSYRTNKLLPDDYYRIREPKKLQAFYKRIGGHFFRKFLLVAYWGREKNRKKYFDGTPDGIANMDYQTRQSEFGHVSSFFVVLASSLILLLNNHILIFLFITFINTIGNFYPVILQRVHRIRIAKIARINNRFKNKTIKS